MAGKVFGLDFGTTNSLLSVIGQDERPIHLTDDKDRPHPSVVWYHGGEVLVGRPAREHIDFGNEVIAGSFVRSPKRLLNSDAPIHVAGRDIDPRDVVTEVLRFLKGDAATAEMVNESPDRAVMTIPVSLDGAGRRRLREAARKAGIGVVQFVHEPLAALYAYLRSQPDYRRRLAELDGCRLLVFDWGGGTLDLTLCQVQRNQVVQIANIGDDDVGGDRFDELIWNEVRDLHARQHGIDDLAGLERDEARLLLRNQCELRKIELSQRESATIFVRNFLRHDRVGRDLSVTLSRSALASWTGNLIARGLGAIDTMLEQNHLTYQQIALCLPTGGMVNMPAIRDGLSERFGARAPRISNGDRIISEGAAWIAHDDLPLGLAKPIEILQSDNSYAPIVPLPFLLPVENEIKPAAAATYYCADPRSGRAAFTFARPSRPRAKDSRSDRQAYTTVHLAVDEAAPPLMELLKVDITVDHDYVAHVDLHSSMAKDHIQTEIFDLEFTLRFPAFDTAGSKTFTSDGSSSAKANALLKTAQVIEAGAVRLNSNVHVQLSWENVPGDLVVLHRPHWFDERSRQYSDWQKEQWVYYKDCPYCHRSRYEFRRQGCDQQQCLWARIYGKVGQTGRAPEGADIRP